MLEFLKFFTQWLNAQGVMPPEVSEEDTGEARENKTWLQQWPEDIDNAYCIRQYRGRLPELPKKDAGVRQLQIMVRNRSHLTCLTQIERVFNFLKDRPEMIEDLDSEHWAIIYCTKPPVKLEDDARGNSRYSLSFSVTTSF